MRVVVLQWRIQDFPQGGAPTPKIANIFQIFAENCMKMKEFGPRGGRASLAPPLDPPMCLVLMTEMDLFTLASFDCDTGYTTPDTRAHVSYFQLRKQH